LREGQLIFTYLHLAADEGLTRRLMETGVTAIGYETIQLADGTLPLLVPMSEVAGRMSVQVGAQYLEKRHGGRGVLLSGLAGVPPAEVVIIGGGVVGQGAAMVAVGLGASVTIIDINIARLRYIEEIMRGRVITVMSNLDNIERSARYADLIIGAVLIPGGKAPMLIGRKTVEKMKPGSVIVDVAVDQGGCIETSRPTTHSRPTFAYRDVVHYCVGNMPAAVPRTSTLALTNETLPYVLELAGLGFEKAVRKNKALAMGVNVHKGKIVHPNVAKAFDLPCGKLV
ncbi:MAG: alanine dehydrogenase, partial [bacterium]